MRTMKLTRKLVAFVGAFALALSLCAFSTQTVHAAAGGYADTGRSVTGQNTFYLTPTSYASTAQLTVEAKNSTTTEVYVAVTSVKTGRTIYADFLPSSLKATKWFNMVSGDTYKVYCVVTNGSAVVAASLWSN